MSDKHGRRAFLKRASIGAGAGGVMLLEDASSASAATPTAILDVNAAGTVKTDGSPGQGAALQTLLNNAGGGLVVWKGTINCSDQPINVPERTLLAGGGQDASILNFPTNFGNSGMNYCVTLNGSQQTASALRDCAVHGPGGQSHPTPLTGTSPYKCNGVGLAGGNTKLDNVYITGFNNGVGLWRDHNYFRNIKVANCFVNVMWEHNPSGIIHGNHVFESCDLQGALFACLGVKYDNFLDQCVFLAGHCGFAPYGIYRFDDGNGRANTATALQTNFINFSFEQIGNAAISEQALTNGGGGFQNCEIRNPGFSWTGQGDNNYQLQNTTQGDPIVLKVCAALQYFGGQYPFVGSDASSDAVAFRLSPYYGHPGTFRFGSSLPNTVFGGNNLGAVCVERDGASGIAMPLHGDCTDGDILQYAGSNQVARYDHNNPRAIAGIAGEAAKDGAYVIVWTKGRVAVTPASGVYPSPADYVRPAASVAHNCEPFDPTSQLGPLIGLWVADGNQANAVDLAIGYPIVTSSSNNPNLAMQARRRHHRRTRQPARRQRKRSTA